MDLSLEVPGNHHFIRAMGDEGIRIGDVYFTRSILVSATTIVPDWPPQTPGELEDRYLRAILDLDPEVVLIGTGARQHFLPQKTVFDFYRENVGIEVMNTQAACRTFNVLVTEGRKVVAALMPVSSA